MEKDYNKRSTRDGNRSDSGRNERSGNRDFGGRRGETGGYRGGSNEGFRRSGGGESSRDGNRRNGEPEGRREYRGGVDGNRANTSREGNRFGASRDDRGANRSSGERKVIHINRERSDRDGNRGNSDSRDSRVNRDNRYSSRDNRDSGNNRDNRGTGERSARPAFRGSDNRERKPYPYPKKTDGNRSFNREERSDRPDRSDRDRSDRPFRPANSDRPYRPSNSDRPGNRSSGERREGGFNRDRQEQTGRGPARGGQEGRGERHSREYGDTENRRSSERGEGQGERVVRRRIVRQGSGSSERPGISREDKDELRQKHYSKKKILAHRLKNENEETELRLNRYISMGGVCSRRDADELIKTGRVKVNDEVVLTVGVKVHKKDRIEVDGVLIIPERKVYLVLNKPKDYVTTVEDPLERKTVMALIDGACKERIYPVGRLDRQTTGVLLFTNDGDLAKKLTHPSYDHKKIYHVFADKPITDEHRQAIANGIELEDGFIKADEISYTSDDKTEVGVEIHSGRNRIVRRIFEHFGYQILKLDRVYFAGITKKNVPRGKWRFLTAEEVEILRFY